MMPRSLVAVVLAMVSIAVYGRGFNAPQVASERALADRVAGAPAVSWTSPFTQIGPDLWMAPALVRASAISVKATASAASPRLLSIAFGSADVALVYLVALTLFGRVSVAIIAALLLLFAPAHATFSQTASM